MNNGMETNEMPSHVQLLMNIYGQIHALHAADIDHDAMNASNPFRLPFEAIVYTSNSNLCCLIVWPLQIVHMY